jgi:signal transduction histidine kinase
LIMKLAAHYNKASIIISVTVLLISGITYYIIINQIARKQLDSNLSEEIAEVIEYVNLNQRLPKPIDFDEDQTTFVKTNLVKFDTKFFDTPYLNPREKKNENGRAVAALIKLNGERYIATIVESRENTEYLIQIIFIITLLLTTVLLSVLIITNRYILNGLWRPFYYILHQVKEFNVSDNKKMNIIEAKADEFTELGDAVSKMSSRVTADYHGLKTFTENASHEIMTPLAVITSKLDTLIQDETLRSDQYAQITDIYSATNKLSRLNQSLLLLVKIDNNLLHDTEKLNIKSIILEKIQQFQELIQNKNIELNYALDEVEVAANKYLTDVLINNLFSNAIKHNKAFGHIKIRLSGDKLIFQNSGETLPLQQATVFTRFNKGRSSEGTGLGLAIMKNICNQHNFALSYQYVNDLHSFEISFD